MDELIKLVMQYKKSPDSDVGDKIVISISAGLHLYISLRLPSRMVDDTLQEALVGIMLGIARFEGDTDAQFHAYCYTIARNKVANALRRVEREPEFQFPEEEFWHAIAEADPVLTEAEQEQLREIMDMLAEVRPPCLTYLVAHYIAGMTYAEICEEFDFPSEDAARQATRRCLLLARELGGD